MALKEFDKGPPRGSDDDCSKPDECRGLGECMNQTFLEVSWSRITPQVYAFTHLVGEVAEQGLKDSSTSMTNFSLTIDSSSTFTMNFKEEKTHNAKDNAVCVKKDTPIVKPETWTITNDGEFKDKGLLVFSLLPQNATFEYVGGQRKGHPDGPRCELFVKFVRCERLQATPCQLFNNNATDYFDDHRSSINGNIRAA
ncbi:unnamed protein product [Meloidogyne enterolobii]|uniref:Uncharacterized protein n=1 Tax=Meloidogyne enterolobii TaxID=390850 RepID=A0ACB0YZT0_MELEN